MKLWSIFSFLLCVTCVGKAAASQADNASKALPLALEMIELEQRLGNATQADFELAQSVLGEMLTVLAQSEQPKTVESAIGISEKIAIVMARRNFLQPISEDDWPDTLGVAFRPIVLDSKRLSQLLAYNNERAPFIDPTKPIYYVDCDMGALLMISAIRAIGWDVRLVTKPKHAFIRWHLPDGENVNWDWTHWRSLPNEFYLQPTGLGRDLIDRGVYLKSLDPIAIRGHYLGLLASEVGDHKAALALGEQAVRDDRHTPLTLNNFAWDLAIDPDGGEFSRDRAVYYALMGWAPDIKNGNRADTVACALAANGEFEVAITLADYAIKYAGSSSDERSFRKSKTLIEQGQLCQ